jgi:hypothetical protein
MASNSWPYTVPCSTGIQLWWNSYYKLTKAAWVGSQIAPTADGLAVCFNPGQCNAGHCVTAGCLPAHTDGFDLFFQSSDSLVSASWLKGSIVTGSIPVSDSANDVFWYGHVPPASPYSTPSTPSAGVGIKLPSTPTGNILGRTATGSPQALETIAPSVADTVEFSWYLPGYESAPSQGCVTVNGMTWASPSQAFAYTLGGALDARVTLPTCAERADGTGMSFNTIDFSWEPSAGGTGHVLHRAAPEFDWSSNSGCQKVLVGSAAPVASAGTPTTYPPNTLAQPPAGTDGVVFGISWDDYKSACWASGSKVIPPTLAAPGHPRLLLWQG